MSIEAPATGGLQNTETAAQAFPTTEVIANKQARVAIDGQIQFVKGLPSSRERSLAITKLQEAVMWLGMDLKRLNEPNPYPNSYDTTNAKVDATADNLKL